MDLFVKIAFLVVFFAVIILVGFRSRKKANSVDGYVLGGRAVGPWLSAFSYGTAYFSAVIFIGYAGQFGWNFGLSATWIGIGNALIGALLAWLVLGRRTRNMSQHLGANTMPSFFGKRFSSQSLRIAAAVIIFIFLIPYTASLYNGLGRLFEMAFGIRFEICIVLMAAVTAVYVLLGGYVASAWNDFIQGIIMLFGIVAVISAVLIDNGGIAAAISSLSEATGGTHTSVLGPNVYSLIMVILLTSFGTWGLPQMIQKFYAIKSDSAIKKGMIISTVFALVIAGGCYFLGGFGRLYADGPIYNQAGGVIFDAIVPYMLSNLHYVIIAIVVVLVFSASMSTLSSLVMTSSSTITLDLINGNIKKTMSDRQQVLYIRSFVAAFIVISAVIAVIQYNFNLSFIAQMMGVSWGALAGAFLAPYLLSLYSKRISKAACWACFVFAVAMSITSFVLTLSGVVITAEANWFLYGVFGSSIFTGVWTMAAGFIIVPVVSLFTKKPDKAYVDALFECVTKKVTAAPAPVSAAADDDKI